MSKLIDYATTFANAQIVLNAFKVLLNPSCSSEQYKSAYYQMIQPLSYFTLNKNTPPAEIALNNLMRCAVVADNYNEEQLIDWALNNNFTEAVLERISDRSESLKEAIEDYEWLRICDTCDQLMFTGLCTDDGETYCCDACTEITTDELAEALEDEAIYYTDWL